MSLFSLPVPSRLRRPSQPSTVFPSPMAVPPTQILSSEAEGQPPQTPTSANCHLCLQADLPPPHLRQAGACFLSPGPRRSLLAGASPHTPTHAPPAEPHFMSPFTPRPLVASDGSMARPKYMGAPQGPRNHLPFMWQGLCTPNLFLRAKRSTQVFTWKFREGRGPVCGRNIRRGGIRMAGSCTTRPAPARRGALRGVPPKPAGAQPQAPGPPCPRPAGCACLFPWMRDVPKGNGPGGRGGDAKPTKAEPRRHRSQLVAKLF